MNAPSSGIATTQPPTLADLPEARDATARIEHIGVVGRGRMGEAFARNLLADGYRLTVFDRSTARRDLLAAAGADAVPDLAGLAAVQVVLTSLPDDDVLTQVVSGADGLVAVLAPGAIHVSLSTVSPGACPRSTQRPDRAMSRRRCSAIQMPPMRGSCS
jgi:3-hydroxyisobutyrate dehydrogenase-like beta-hydroxyacid dehydrogenase